MQYLQVILIVQEIKLAYVQKCKENTWTVHDQLFNLPMKFDFLKKVYNFMWKNVIKKGDKLLKGKHATDFFLFIDLLFIIRTPFNLINIK